LDGVPIDASVVTSLNPSDIEIIEILKGPEAAIYGSRGANGVIAFYSRRGHFMKRGVIEFGMLGYYRARDFYVPAYNSWNYKPTDYNVPRTLYWKPYVMTDSEGIATIRFKNRLKILKYITTIEGMTSNGEIVLFKE
jgi:TonB-dependent SusC/RagA subfamily outer membrane receptor